MNKNIILTAAALLVILVSMIIMVQPTMRDKYTAGYETGNASDTIKLPSPVYDSEVSIEEALYKRRSIRGYKDEPLELAEVSQLLWAAQGITDLRNLRTAPSAGALYPIETYLVAGNVSGIAAGIYKYNPHLHELVKVVEGDKRAELCDAALGQAFVGDAPAAIVFSAVYERTTGKYGERGTQYVHMEAGHASQNVYLQAVSLNIGTVAVGAFNDDEVKAVMEMPANEYPVYLMPIGRK